MPAMQALPVLTNTFVYACLFIEQVSLTTFRVLYISSFLNFGTFPGHMREGPKPNTFNIVTISIDMHWNALYDHPDKHCQHVIYLLSLLRLLAPFL